MTSTSQAASPISEDHSVRSVLRRIGAFAGFLFMGLWILVVTRVLALFVFAVEFALGDLGVPQSLAAVLAALAVFIVFDLGGVAVLVYFVIFGALPLALPRIVRRSRIRLALAVAGILTVAIAYFAYVNQELGFGGTFTLIDVNQIDLMSRHSLPDNLPFVRRPSLPDNLCPDSQGRCPCPPETVPYYEFDQAHGCVVCRCTPATHAPTPGG